MSAEETPKTCRCDSCLRKASVESNVIRKVTRTIIKTTTYVGRPPKCPTCGK